MNLPRVWWIVGVILVLIALVVCLVPGRELPGVMAYRDLDDVHAMIAAAEKPGAQAVVIGGGLLGLEAAAGLKARGMDVTVLHLMGHLMERQLDPAAGYLLQKDLERRGIRVHCKASTKAILGHEKVDAFTGLVDRYTGHLQQLTPAVITEIRPHSAADRLARCSPNPRRPSMARTRRDEPRRPNRRNRSTPTAGSESSQSSRIEGHSVYPGGRPTKHSTPPTVQRVEVLREHA